MYMYPLRPDSQPSLFQNWPTGFKVSWPASKWACPMACFKTGRLDGFEPGWDKASWPALKWACPIHNRWKVMACFKTGWLDGFEPGWDRVNGFKTSWTASKPTGGHRCCSSCSRLANPRVCANQSYSCLHSLKRILHLFKFCTSERLG